MSAILRRLRSIIAGYTTKRLHHSSSIHGSPSSDVNNSPFLLFDKQHQLFQEKLGILQSSPKRRNPHDPMAEASHEVVVYIHRFHNLDLFQQGWYQIKIMMRWEDDDGSSAGVPSRVVQYEAPDLGCEDVLGVWKIDDVDHSFSTPPFRIRYARQDILLSMMVAFNLSLSAFEGLSTSAVILKFELLYTPTLGVSSGVQSALDGCPAAAHEFRLSSRSLLGLHSYCPVHFDFFHSVLVDVTVHISLVKGGYTSQSKVPSAGTNEAVPFECYDKTKKVMLFRAFVAARDILIEELHAISTAINPTINAQDFSSKPKHLQLFGSLSEANQDGPHAEDLGEVLSKPLPITQKSNGSLDLQDETIDCLSKDELLHNFQLIGNQTLYLWRTFLNFHRVNRAKVLEYLRDQWALDRKAEWSIWMVYSKVDMPHQYIGSDVNSTFYQAPDLGCEDVLGVWKIDDVDHSFSTPPFRIRYARQDILLSMMVAFNLSLSAFEGLSTSAVILKFELLYTPTLGVSSGVQSALDGCPAAAHEFRLSSRSLLGLHSYCPVHFDFFHSVLVDVTVHISLVKGGYTSQSKVPSAGTNEAVPFECYDKTKKVMLFRAFVAARDILIEELHAISTAINPTINAQDFSSKPKHLQLFGSLSEANQDGPHAEDLGEVLSKPLPITQKSNGSLDLQDETIDCLSKDELLHNFQLIGNQTLYLWRTFLNFHRVNRAKVLEYLRDQWALDRKAEWSIWMVYSKVDMPHQYIGSDVNSTFYQGGRGRAPVMKKTTEDPAQTAAMRAELRRRSIAQMKINNRFIQDLHIFGDPSRIPIVIVERALNAPRPSAGGLNMASAQNTRHAGRILKIVVFVNGFQGHHLDLRLVRNQWLMLDPKIEFLMSETNEEKTSGDFREMGRRLAQEVTAFIKKKMDKASRSGNLKSIKISFVGHSIGNVILRTALTESIMEPYLQFLHTYVSVSGPHLGYLYSSNSLFNSGLWLLKMLKGTQCIHQLTFTDDPDLRKTFLFNLCKQKTLDNFENIILISSPQDGYVPYHSARIEACQASSGDKSKKGKLFLEMVNECLDQIRAPSSEHRVFMRCDVNFDTSLQGRNINTMIGRAAHIEFLESDVFARFIMWSFPELFR